MLEAKPLAEKNSSEEEKKNEKPAEEMVTQKAEEKPAKRMNRKKLVGYIVLGIVVVIIAVQLLNASYYKMTVNVVEGENIVGVNPTAEKLDFGDLSRGNGMTRYVTLQSAGSVPSYIMIWKFGAVSSLVTVEKNYFVLEPEKELKIAFTITVPPSAETKRYDGQVILFKLPKIF